jgi:hypothetical protein
LLWEPVAPSPLPTQDQTLGSIQPFDLSCYPQVLQNNFELAKSAIQYGRKTYLTRLHRCVFCFHVDNPVSRKYNSMYQLTSERSPD